MAIPNEACGRCRDTRLLQPGSASGGPVLWGVVVLMLPHSVRAAPHGDHRLGACEAYLP